MAWCGPADHGITMFGRQLFEHAVAVGFGGSPVTAPGPAGLAELVPALPPTTRLLHLQVNDWMFADASATARDRLVDFASRLRDRGIALSVTLHDLPHTAVSEELYRRRVATYAAVAEVAAGIVVASRHEAQLLATAVREAGSVAGTPAVTVIPLPIDVVRVGTPPRRDPAVPPTVGIFGFLYPGKGHAEVLDELAGIVPAVRIVAVGQASTGHGDLPGELASRAEASGLSFTSTGFVADDEVDGLLRSVDVPVAPAAQVSASGSINSWIAAGRRPLVRAGAYTRELAARHPGAVQLYEPGELGAGVLAALAAPASTWQPAGAVVDAGPDVTARRYVDWLRALAARC